VNNSKATKAEFDEKVKKEENGRRDVIKKKKKKRSSPLLFPLHFLDFMLVGCTFGV